MEQTFELFQDGKIFVPQEKSRYRLTISPGFRNARNLFFFLRVSSSSLPSSLVFETSGCVTNRPPVEETELPPEKPEAWLRALREIHSRLPQSS